LLQIKICKTGTVGAHMIKFYDIMEKLKEVGFLVQEEILTLILLSSLPQSFEGFVIALETQDELPSLSITSN